MNYSDKILDLLSGNLSEEETILFQKEMANNEELKQEVAFQKGLMEIIDMGDDDTREFRNELKSIGKEFLAEQKPKVFMRPTYWLAAASVTTILTITSLLGLFNNKGANTEQLFVEYYQPYKLNLDVRGEDNKLNDIDKAIQLYENGNVTSALHEFERLEADNTELAGFFSSLCYLELGRIDQCKEKLKFIQKQAIFYAEDIDWYLSLCYLKKNEISSAKDILSQIIASNNQYSNDASDIYDKLK